MEVSPFRLAIQEKCLEQNRRLMFYNFVSIDILHEVKRNQIYYRFCVLPINEPYISIEEKSVYSESRCKILIIIIIIIIAIVQIIRDMEAPHIEAVSEWRQE